MHSGNTLLSVRQLSIEFDRGDRTFEAVRGISLDVKAGSIVALIGESGSGKSVTAQAVFGLLERSGRVTAGEAWLGDVDLLTRKPGELRRIRGRDMAMIFQNPASCLNPAFTIGHQMIETIVHHRRVSRREARDIALVQLEQVGLAEPERLLRRYSFQISGGMCQRVMIALALVSGARLLIADEPTTALDVTIQAQILDELDRLRRERGIGILLITHDLGVVAELADFVYVMKEGEIVESGDVYDIFEQPKHPYTRELLDSRFLYERSMEESPSSDRRGNHAARNRRFIQDLRTSKEVVNQS
ncbi:ABC transporter ATP-binding protein [Cohnella lupini]|uniref:Nickel import system ATP-binding protein NikD n=1 Tax=Cohnella lupini TaxID=1294267 RepID=A0A3D9INI9_9BACL|nr:ABC transporter ATP-binding protein [Cohnella lupini]RED63267.1 peptide/nickel transport system ATP-binding protein [Cohnella lupini]